MWVMMSLYRGGRNAAVAFRRSIKKCFKSRYCSSSTPAGKDWVRAFLKQSLSWSWLHVGHPLRPYLVAAMLAAQVLCPVPCAGAEDWHPPETPKDDEHWYPERPVLEKPLEKLENGNFEEAAPAEAGRPLAPKGWAHPDGLTALWTTDPAAPEHGKIILLDTDVLESEAKKRQAALRKTAEDKSAIPEAPRKSALTQKEQYDAIGATYGVSYYSQNLACKPKQAYKISFDFKGPSGGAKVWVRGWGPFQEETRRRWETIVNCRTGGNEWTHFEQAFHPTRRPLSKEKITYIEISYFHVMLYAYWPRGQYRFDNIQIEEISDAEYERLKAIPAGER